MTPRVWETGQWRLLSVLVRVSDVCHRQAAAADDAEASVAVYQEYVRHELAEGTPARVQCVFERALRQHCLSLPLWQAYTRYLDFELKPAPELTLAVHERAVRNLPWSGQLWEAYIRASERAARTADQLQGRWRQQVPYHSVFAQLIAKLS